MKTKTTIQLIKKISLILFFCASALTGTAQTVSLQVQGDYTVGNAINSPRYAVGDVNNDGKPDLVTLNKATSNSQPLSVFLNNGAGGFGTALNLTDGTLSPNAVVIGDYNKDGNPDLAIAGDGTSNGINIRLGNGTGNFPTGSYIAAERGSSAIVSADFNGDGNLDVAICNNVSVLRVLNGNGTGGFGAAFELSLAVPTSGVEMRFATIDANLDGKADIIIGRQDGFFLYNGNSALFTRTENDFDGKTEVATYRPSEGNWYIPQCADYKQSVQKFGASGDVAVPSSFIP
ncbi:MAG: FG-GAP repeat domain-containing protein [Pyrinomonadaceae bacterium]